MSQMDAPPSAPTTNGSTKTYTTMEVVKGQKIHVTPPSYVDDATINLSANSLKVLERRYLRRDIDGTLLETSAGMFYRVAHHIAGAEAAHGGDVDATNKIFYDLLAELRFFPNSPTFTGAGTPLGQLAACFVLPIADDMGRDADGIFSTLRVAALIQQTGGGNGFSFSRLRPKGDVVHTSSGRATGPVGFLRVYDQAFGEIAQGGSRRGANMAVLRVDHPDIEQFITCKAEEGTVTNFNISVAITDDFMLAVKNDTDFDLRSPRDGKVWKTVRAQELFAKIIHYAHRNGEPGALFIDAANRSNPVPHLYNLEATNPCGEQWLGPYENCCLGSIHLGVHVAEDADGAMVVDWAALERTIRESTHFLDNVVSANAYVPVVPEVAEAAFRARRIGLGIMGLGDLMYKLGIRYGSAEGQEFAGQVMEFVRYHCMAKSIELSEERGPFLAFQGSIYDPEKAGGMLWQPPTPLVSYTRDWGRPVVNWSAIVEGIQRHGIRNAAQTTVAPTGCLVSGTLVVTDQGVLPIDQLGQVQGEQWQNIKYMVASEGGNLPATQFYINGRAHTLRVVTKRGYQLQGTDQHRIRVWQDGVCVWRRMDELEPGMRVPLKAAGLVGEPRPVSLITTQVTDFHPTPITLPTEMTPELAYLIGFFMGDGSLKERTLRFAVSDAATQERLLEYMHRIFGIDGKVLTDPRSNPLKSVEFHSRNLVAFWRTNGFAKASPDPAHRGKGYEPHIPAAVLASNDAIIYGAFLAGLFDADGSLHQERLLIWTTTNQALHDQVKVLLLVLGILTTSDLQTTGLGNSVSHRLRTAHTQAALRLMRQLPYLCRLTLGEMTVRRKTLGDTIPLSQHQYEVALAMTTKTDEERGLWGWRQRKLQASRSSLASFVADHRRELLTSDLHNLVVTIDNDIFFDEIETIQDGGWQNTYDISVPQSHAYIANGFVSHNTIATVSGCEGYGCEPVFALGYIRHFKDGDKDVELAYTSPLFEQALDKTNLSEARKKSIKQHAATYGSIQDLEGLPEKLRHTFVVSSDISADEHVRMQAALQAFVDNSLSKTINFPEGATEEDVANAYLLAWELGCKGLTVYVTGSRQEVVLETKATKEKKGEGETAAESSPNGHANSNNGYHPDESLPVFTKRPRPLLLQGSTYRKDTPLGTAYITVNSDAEGEPFEVFLNIGKAGSDVSAVSEALGRLISLTLRMPAALPPSERLRWVMDEMAGIGGGRALGFGANRVRSLPDGVAQVIAEHLSALSAHPQPVSGEQMALPLADRPIGDLCPDCGEAAFLNVEGCKKCHICGYSEC
ncbi:MAG: adenosylcobalamin-dependent ribonucleoside-diphosphate reductase [Chloroflexi bacterium]|nr:adenosylcobalamin-dependent ribonucleoside-diphosphate reductase [Chloroflexota bacterium]